MRLTFGSGGGGAPPWQLALWALGIAALAICVLASFAIWGALAAHGGCNIPPPSDPLTGRRDEICAELRREPECMLRIRRTVGGHVEATERDFLLYIAGEFIGQFPIVNGMTVDPDDLNTELVRRSLLYRMGDPEVRARVRRAIRARVAWVNSVLDWRLGRADVEIAVGR